MVSGVLGQDLAAYIGGHAGTGGDGSAVGAHYLAAERLLLVAHLDHVDLAIQPEIAAGHGERGAPLAGARLSGHAFQALLLGVVGLRNGAVQLVAAAGVVALELIVDLGRGAQGFFQPVGAAPGDSDDTSGSIRGSRPEWGYRRWCRPAPAAPAHRRKRRPALWRVMGCRVPGLSRGAGLFFMSARTLYHAVGSSDSFR